MHRVAVWAEARDNPCLAPSHRWVVCTIATNVAQRELLRVTELRRGGSLRFTIASLESLAPTIHACCQLTAVADILFN